jgi:hypothetical protein
MKSYPVPCCLTSGLICSPGHAIFRLGFGGAGILTDHRIFEAAGMTMKHFACNSFF